MLSKHNSLRNNKMFRFLYKCRTYMNIGISQTNWFSGKLPELMSIVYFLEKLGKTFSTKGTIILCIIIFFSFLVFGYLYVQCGLFHSERHVETNIDPIQHEIYQSAKKINKSDKL